ncbi:MAG: hypothetical protein OEX77_10040 [Candidatus Bathyarchaeota archaeon]|nr:hypothetical protein [Candidatus Bathyarchaeota archaeon]
MSTAFSVVKAIVHDVAVISVVPSANEVFPCQMVNISVVVMNEGDVSETFDVNCYYDSVLIGMLAVENLPLLAEKALTFSWFTCCIPPRNYSISAEASVVLGEIDIGDNRFSNGVVRIKPWMLPSPVEYVLPRWLSAYLFSLAVLVGAYIVLLAGLALRWTCERKKEVKNKQLTGAAVKARKETPSKTGKTCGVCEREFPGVYTFCPYCLTFHGKDYRYSRA